MKTLIIGIGNEFRSDDAIGIRTARKIENLALKNIRVILNNGDGTTLMDYWKDYDEVIMIDASRINSHPGFINIIDANKTQIPKEISSHSSHLFSVAEAIEMARVMNTLPKKLKIYAIEGKNFENGIDISGDVLKASDEVIKNILDDVNN